MEVDLDFEGDSEEEEGEEEEEEEVEARGEDVVGGEADGEGLQQLNSTTRLRLQFVFLSFFYEDKIFSPISLNLDLLEMN